MNKILTASATVGTSFIAGIITTPIAQKVISPHLVPNATAADPERSAAAQLSEAVSIPVDEIFKDAANFKAESQFRRAYDRLSQVPQSSPRFAEAQKEMQQCAALILDRAQDKYAQGDTTTAIRYVESIPKESEAFKIADATLLGTWRRQAALLEDADRLIKQQRWSEAEAVLNRFRDDPLYQSSKLKHRLATVQTQIKLASAGRSVASLTEGGRG